MLFLLMCSAILASASPLLKRQEAKTSPKSTPDSTKISKLASPSDSLPASKKSDPKTSVTATEGPKIRRQPGKFNNYVAQMSDIETREDQIYQRGEDLKKESQRNEDEINQSEGLKAKLKEDNKQLPHSSGAEIITFKGITYFVFIADLDSVDIRLHWRDAKNKAYNNIGNLLRSQQFHDNPPLMITNAGMFNPDITPEGLLIENGVVKAPLNTTKPNSENFYLKPNGVFYITKDGTAHIDVTENFKDSLSDIQQATQSGPMLVINGKIHDKFTRASNNKKIRSGVGLLGPKKVVFIISQTEVNFYDFAVLFKDIYNCPNALFLDGAISKMYLHDLNPSETGGYFCTFISATKKKHSK
jgi:uncharacterized protein YigE (DUF2233 family)